VTDAAGEAWDGLTGRRLPRAEAADHRPAKGPEDIHPAFLSPHPTQLRVRVSVARRHRNAFETVLGGDVEQLAPDLAGALPAGWGLHEPGGMPWDREALTTHARTADRPTRVIVAGSREGRALTGSVAAHRTTAGIEEISELLVDLGPENAVETAERMSGVARALESIAAGVPLFAAAFADPGRADLFRAARFPRPFWPLALLVGAPAVRALRIDVHGVAAHHEGKVVGGRRTPSLLLDLSGCTAPASWIRLRAFADALGVDRLHEASPAMAQMLFGGTRDERP
jgi:hypothetical protein